MPVMFSILSILGFLIYAGIIVGVIIFLVKAVKYFMRQEVLLREISTKLDQLNENVKASKG